MTLLNISFSRICSNSDVIKKTFHFPVFKKNNNNGKMKEKKVAMAVGKQTHDLTVTASDSKTTQSGGDNRKKFPLGAALQVQQNFSFAPL